MAQKVSLRFNSDLWVKVAHALLSPCHIEIKSSGLYCREHEFSWSLDVGEPFPSICPVHNSSLDEKERDNKKE